MRGYEWCLFSIVKILSFFFFFFSLLEEKCDEFLLEIPLTSFGIATLQVYLVWMISNCFSIIGTYMGHCLACSGQMNNFMIITYSFHLQNTKCGLS